MAEQRELDPGFTTAAMRALWSLEARAARMIEVELALAEAAHEAGAIPRAALEAIRRAAAQPPPDAGALFADGWRDGTPVIPLVAWLRSHAGEEHARFVHFGATSQDVLDTATVLALRASFDALARALEPLADELHARMTAHAGAWVPARTLLQPAPPIQLSVRLARWLDPILTQLEALAAARAALPLQLGGPVGDLSTFGAAGGAIAASLARRLELALPGLPWHADRGVVVRAVELAAAVARACATIANNLLVLSQRELGEVQLDAAAAGRSSSLPGKRNAHHAVRALAAARACYGAASIVTAAHPHELERAAGSWQAESLAVPLVMQTAAAVVEAAWAALRAASFATERADLAPPSGGSHGEAILQHVTARYAALRGGSSHG